MYQHRLFKIITKFLHYSYTIAKKMPEHPYDFIGVISKYILHLLILHKIHILRDKCDVIVGTNTVVIVNNTTDIVYRIPLNKYASYGICRNYHFLVKYHNILSIPSAISLNNIGTIYLNNKMFYSCESKLKSNMLLPNEINNKKITYIFYEISILYKTAQKSMIVNINDILDNYDYLLMDFPQKWIDRLFLIKYNIKNIIASFNTDTHFEVVYTKIHGDFTFRNILLNSRIEFIDFDRSELNFPEIDLFLFLNILKTYKQCENPKYNLLFDNIFVFIDKKTICPQIDHFYELNKVFCKNKKILPIIKYCFFYRTLIYIILNFRFYDPEVEAILDKCFSKIKKI